MARVINAAGFADLRSAWDDLYRRRDRTNLFVTHAWLANWAAHFAPTFAVAVAGDASRLDAALPVWREGDRWSSLGDHSYRPEVLSDRPVDQVVGPLVNALAAEAPGPVVLLGTPATPDARAAFDRANASGAVVAIDKYERSIRVIDTAAPYEDYLASRPKKVRQELRRKRRKLERELRERGPRLWSDPDEMDEAFAAVIDIESESWKDDADTSIASSPVEQAFYRGVLDLEGPDLEPRVYTLSDHGRPFVFILGVVHRETFFALKASYRASYGKLSPGGNIFGYVIEQMCADPAIEQIDLLGTDARWKRELASVDDPVFLVELHRRSLRSIAYAVSYQRVRPALKELVEDNPRLGRLVKRLRAIAQLRPSTIAEAIAAARSRST